MRKTVLIALTAISLILGASALASAAPTASYKVTIATSTASSEAGKFITVSGKVFGPKAAGKTVKIQRKYVGGAWTTITNAVIKADGKYAARVETPRGGSTSFRAIKAKSTVRKAGTSPTKTVKVFEWLYLANEGPFVGSGKSQMPMLQTIDGVDYQRSMGFEDGAWSAFYKVRGAGCTKFTTRVAHRAGDAPAAGAMTFAIGLSGFGISDEIDKFLDVDSSLTAATPIVADVWYLQFAIVDLDPGNSAALGNPRVYCNADHLPSFNDSDIS